MPVGDYERLPFGIEGLSEEWSTVLQTLEISVFWVREYKWWCDADAGWYAKYDILQESQKSNSSICYYAMGIYKTGKSGGENERNTYKKDWKKNGSK